MPDVTFNSAPSRSVTSAPALMARLVHLANDIKLSHSIFALPFAVLASFLAAASLTPELPRVSALALIIVCMVLGRTMAMAVNRWADASLDALNRRTAGRAIPTGRLSGRFVLMTAVICGVGLVIAAAGFWWLHDNPWPVICSPLVLAWLTGYSFTKRYTWLCHAFLGAALALSPLAAAIAIKPASLSGIEPYLLAFMVICWVAGFDVIYALQDVAVDRKTGIYSLPAAFGIEPALWTSRCLHAFALAALIALAYLSPVLNAGFSIGIVIVAALLILEHALVWKSDTHHMHLAFFTVNGIISLVLGTLGVWDIVRGV